MNGLDGLEVQNVQAVQVSGLLPATSSFTAKRRTFMTKLETPQRTLSPPSSHALVEQRYAARGSLPVPGWLDASELAAANAAYFAMGDEVSRMTDEALRARLKAILQQEIGFIHNQRFAERKIGDEIFAQPLGLPSGEESRGRGSAVANMPAHFGRLCAAPLLAPEQERMLFERMNFLRYHAAQRRSMLTPMRPSRAQLALVERLLSLADWHRDRIVEANLRLVFSIVKKFVNQHNGFDDLLSDGIVALIRASDKFDFARGFRFSTYATQVVRRDAYRCVVQRQEERRKVSSGLQDMELDISDECRTPAMSETRWHALRSCLTAMLGDLDRREKLIIRARFALGSHRRVQTLQSLADRLGVSKERVRQLEKRAMEKLSAMAAKIELGSFEQEIG